MLALLFATAIGTLCAQTAAAPDEPTRVASIDRPHADDWSSDINADWRVHDGDDPAWAAPGFDDTAWEQVRLDGLGAARPGWRWYRLHIKLSENHPDLTLLIEGGVGVYELYINGARVPGPRLRSSFGVNRPIERTFPLDMPESRIDIALRTYAPPAYSSWRLPLFMTATVGTPDAIEAQRQALESDRIYTLIPSVAINLLLLLAGIGVLSLNRSQRNHSEYLWLGLYLFLVGAADLLWYFQYSGYLPLSANLLLADPLLYLVTVAQIEFTFSFGGRRPTLAWRLYEALLLLAPAMTWLSFFGILPSVAYMVMEPALLVPVALLLPILLYTWYRHGNREAGWLILPSLLPAATMSLYDLGTLSIFFGWKRFEFLDNSIQLGPVPIEPNDVGNLLFLLAITIVIFFRFTRVSRDQARAAAELGAAREIQQRLVPATLPQIPGFQLEAAYLPAQEVGGDFYQVLSQSDGSALVIVGDVSGKGLKAAMTGALAIGALRALAAENLGPAVLLSRLNNEIRNAEDGGFITCLCTRIAPDGAVTVANAGHLSPYRRGEEIPVDPGLPLGIAAGIEYMETRSQLEPGDTMTLISDGVVEARNSSGQLYGFERTRAISMQPAGKIASTAQTFGQEDDITVLTLTRRGVGDELTAQSVAKTLSNRS
ncbi:MAG: PP2C family protein-serine/threonine phosphatase [Terracidiphilus sp.]